MTRFFNTKKGVSIVILVLLAFPLFLLIAPKSIFDNGPPLCLITLISGHNCPGCGMTRACIRIIHFDFIGAWHFNKMSFIVFPYFAFKYTRLLIEKINQWDTL